MARKIPEEKLNLNELVPLYGEQNTQCNALKKVVADLNTKLKQAIKEADKSNEDITIDGWTCKLSVTDESVFNEERLLEFVKKHKIDVVRTKEYVDYDELEKLIYNGKIDKKVIAAMNECRDEKTKETLRINKTKEN